MAVANDGDDEEDVDDSDSEGCDSAVGLSVLVYKECNNFFLN